MKRYNISLIVYFIVGALFLSLILYYYPNKDKDAVSSQSYIINEIVINPHLPKYIGSRIENIIDDESMVFDFSRTDIDISDNNVDIILKKYDNCVWYQHIHTIDDKEIDNIYIYSCELKNGTFADKLYYQNR